MAAPPQQALLEQERSFERLYRRHRRHVYAFVLRDLQNPDDAEDVTQTAFLNAYRALRAGSVPERPRAWLLTIARNVCRRRFHVRATRPLELQLDPELAAAREEYEGPGADEIAAALGRLPEKQREAMLLREFEGRPYVEIAEVLGLSVSAVETLLFRARRRLREELTTADMPSRRSLRGLLLLPLPAGLANAFESTALALGRTGLAARAAGVLAAAAVGTGGTVGLGLLSPDAAEKAAPPVAQQVPVTAATPAGPAPLEDRLLPRAAAVPKDEGGSRGSASAERAPRDEAKQRGSGSLVPLDAPELAAPEPAVPVLPVLGLRPPSLDGGVPELPEPPPLPDTPELPKVQAPDLP